MSPLCHPSLYPHCGLSTSLASNALSTGFYLWQPLVCSALTSQFKGLPAGNQWCLVGAMAEQSEPAPDTA